ncbi:unnamed protein product [Linum tenue]|uniref:Cystatin domain-containing protein n=1 Tax=Linum tenue TaxID=586396 RepID=A0AAV0P4I0_9ROSI|nr:unnamed protein product [Linum tenue]
MKPVTFLVALTTVAVVLSTVSASPYGGWQPIKNIHNYRIQEIAKFAVGMHNYENNFKHPLRLVSIRRGLVQVVDGMNYKLDVMVAEGNSLDSRGSMYRTEVHVRLGAMELIFFTRIVKGLN